MDVATQGRDVKAYSSHLNLLPFYSTSLFLYKNVQVGVRILPICYVSGPCHLHLVIATHVAGAWTERQKMFLGGSFLKLADDDV